VSEGGREGGERETGIHAEKDKKIERQTERQIERQTERQMERREDRETQRCRVSMRDLKGEKREGESMCVYACICVCVCVRGSAHRAMRLDRSL